MSFTRSELPVDGGQRSATDRRAEILANFESAWRTGKRPQISEFIPPQENSDNHRREIVRDLLKIEFQFRRDAGENPTLDDYRMLLPEFETELFSLLKSASPSIADGQVADQRETILIGSQAGAWSQETTLGYEPQASSETFPRIGHYEILGEIARGGMGVVYRAVDRQLDRLVALKLIKAGELADAEQIERFQTEAKAAAQLEHPGIVQVYEVGQHGNQHFMTMAYVDGHSLWQEVKASPLSPKRSARLMQQVAEAVQYAHNRGIVHRDLKPQNILLTKDGQPKVTDFGLAKRQESDSSLTETGQALGTPSYMPPEQAQGKIKEIGPLADVYSLGATLFCLLTGRPPFQAATQLETMMQVIEQEPVSPKSLNRAVSVDLETICLRCLEKEPARRYATAAALADDLGRFLNGEPIRARPVGRLEQTLKWIARKPMTAAAYGLSALTAVLAVIGVTISMFWRNAESARVEAVTARGEAESARMTAEAAKAEAELARNEADMARQKTEVALESEQQARAGEVQARKELEETKAWNQYVLNVRLAPALWDQGLIVNARQALDECPTHLRQWEWNYLRRRLHPELAVMSGHTRRILDMQLGADESLLGTSRDGVRLWDTRDGREVGRITELVDNVRALSFSPDGSRFAAGSDMGFGGEAGNTHALVVWDVVGRQKIMRIDLPHGVISLAYSPDGTRLAAGLRNGTLKLWNAADMTEIPVEGRHPNGIAQLVYLHGGTRLASACWVGHLQLRDLVTGKLLQSIDAHTRHVLPGKARPGGGNTYSLVALPGERELVLVTRDHIVSGWDAETLAEKFVWRSDNEVGTVSYNPDRSKVAFSSDQKNKIQIRDVRTGTVWRELHGHPDQVSGIAFAPDDLRFASSSRNGDIRLWDIESGELLKTFSGHATGVSSLMFSRDGTRLFSSAMTGIAAIWDLTEPPEVTRFINQMGPAVAAISPDGTLAAYARDKQSLLLRNLLTGEELMSRPGEQGEILQLRFSPDNRTLASAGSDGTIRLWDVANTRDPVILRGHAGRVQGISFSPQGDTLVSCGSDRMVKLWQVPEGKVLTTWVGHEHEVKGIAFRPDGAQVASASLDNTVRLWDVARNQDHRKLTWDVPLPTQMVNYYWLLEYSPDGTRIASTHDRIIRVWDTGTGDDVVKIEAHHKVLTMKYNRDSSLLVYGGYHNNIQRWDLLRSRKLDDLRGHGNEIRQLCFSPDETRLASASMDGTVRLWNTANWQEMASLKSAHLPGAQLQYNPAGTKLISAGMDGTVACWTAVESSDEREARQRLQPRTWRLGELQRAEETQNWYAAVFHLGWLLLDQPEDTGLKSRHAQALQKLQQAGSAAPPPARRTALSGGP